MLFMMQYWLTHFTWLQWSFIESSCTCLKQFLSWEDKQKTCFKTHTGQRKLKLTKRILKITTTLKHNSCVSCEKKRAVHYYKFHTCILDSGRFVKVASFSLKATSGYWVFWKVSSSTCSWRWLKAVRVRRLCEVLEEP